MDISYRREMNHNYIIIMPDEAAEDGYETRMLASNQIEGLLKFRIRHWEDKKEYYYEITSRQPLSRLLDRKKIKGEEIRRLLLGIAATLNRIEDYLLKEENILLEPEYIYIEPDSFSSGLCMVPGSDCDFPSQFTGLLQYLLEKVDHQDKDGVILAYNLYHESLKENYGIVDLLRLLSPEKLSGREDRERRKNEKLPFPEEDEEGKREAHVKNYIQEIPEQSRNDSFRTVGGERGDDCWTKRVESDQKQDRKHENEGRIPWFKIALLIVAAEAAIWFLAGEELLLQYGPAAGVIVAATSIMMSLFGGKRRPLYTEETQERPSGTPKEESGKMIREAKGEIISEEFRTKRWDAPRKAPEKASKAESREEPIESWDFTVEPEAYETKKEVFLEGESKEVETVLLTNRRNGEGMATLESLDREQESIMIPYVPFVIGKHEELADYCLNHPTVSRLHLRLEQKEGIFIVTDLNSTNGTTVGDYHLQANETVSIKSGDRLCLADLEYRFWEKYKM